MKEKARSLALPILAQSKNTHARDAANDISRDRNNKPASPFPVTIAVLPFSDFPSAHVALQPASIDLDGTPLYFGRAHLPNGSICPCKIRANPGHSGVACLVPFAGREKQHTGPFELLPFDHERMELVKVTGADVEFGNGGRWLKPVAGGKESDGTPLWHAIADMNGVKTPGKAARHLVCPQSD